MSSSPGQTVTSTSPAFIQAVLDLFEGPLAEVRFPGVDRESLAAAEAEVEARRVELQRALETVACAREQLELAQGVFFEQARRAHAYATVFADGDAELLARLGKIEIESRAPAPKKPRGRPPRQRGKHQTSLTVADDAA